MNLKNKLLNRKNVYGTWININNILIPEILSQANFDWFCIDLEHSGIDYTSLFRVFFKSILLQDNSSGGGSTISQQLAKNIYGRGDYGWFSMPVNKTKEMILAKRFEALYSKQDIIAMYLNTVAFSENVFGIESHSFMMIVVN